MKHVCCLRPSCLWDFPKWSRKKQEMTFLDFWYQLFSLSICQYVSVIFQRGCEWESVFHVSVMKVYGVSVLSLLKQSLYICHKWTSWSHTVQTWILVWHTLISAMFSDMLYLRKDLSTYECHMEFDWQAHMWHSILRVLSGVQMMQCHKTYIISYKAITSLSNYIPIHTSINTILLN